jgi:DNA-binding NtrC family response regulator
MTPGPIGPSVKSLTASRVFFFVREARFSRVGTAVLVIDDDVMLGRFIARDLARLGFETVAADSGTAGIEILKQRSFDAVICDLNMPTHDGFDVLRFSTTLDPAPPFVMLTAYGSVQAAVEAMRLGAADFVEKPVKTEELSATIRAILRRAPKRVRPQSSSHHAAHLVGSALWLGPFLETLDRVAQSDATVLIDGETGTGKTAVAREIWKASRRSDGPFVELNCAAIPDHLVESELFGHVKGAFTGATDDHAGKVARADGGTLFLDEVGELKHELQAKLLHLLQERTFTPIGAGDTKRANVRFLAATNRDLRTEVNAGNFRQDLFFRLEVVSLTIPPLRARTDDVPILVEHFCRSVQDRVGSSVEFSPEAMVLLRRYDWPGNIRELENLIERCAVMHPPGTSIRPEHLSERIRGSTHVEPETIAVPEFVTSDIEALPLAEAVRNYETGLIKAALEKAGGNRSQAAKLLKVKRTTLIEKLKKLGE